MCQIHATSDTAASSATLRTTTGLSLGSNSSDAPASTHFVGGRPDGPATTLARRLNDALSSAANSFNADAFANFALAAIEAVGEVGGDANATSRANRLPSRASAVAVTGNTSGLAAAFAATSDVAIVNLTTDSKFANLQTNETPFRQDEPPGTAGDATSAPFGDNTATVGSTVEDLRADGGSNDSCSCIAAMSASDLRSADAVVNTFANNLFTDTFVVHVIPNGEERNLAAFSVASSLDTFDASATADSSDLSTGLPNATKANQTPRDRLGNYPPLCTSADSLGRRTTAAASASDDATPSQRTSTARANIFKDLDGQSA